MTLFLLCYLSFIVFLVNLLFSSSKYYRPTTTTIKLFEKEARQIEKKKIYFIFILNICGLFRLISGLHWQPLFICKINFIIQE